METTIIYVIYHKCLEDTNMFTTDPTQLKGLIEQLEQEYEETTGEWRYRIIREGEKFQADMNAVVGLRLKEEEDYACK